MDLRSRSVDRFLFSAVFILCVGAGSTSFWAQEPTPTVTPTPTLGGSEGEPIKAATPVGEWITYTLGKEYLTPLPCDKRREIVVEVSHPGTDCSTFDLTDISHEAQALFDAQAAQVKCPKDSNCSNRHVVYTYYLQDCPGTSAIVRLRGFVVCASPGNKDGTREGFTFPRYRKKPWDNSEPADWKAPLSEDSNSISGIAFPNFPVGLAFPCPSEYYVKFTYKEPLAKGVQPDSQAVIARAKDQGMELFKLYSCEKDCKLKDFQPLYVKWQVGTDYIYVWVYFKVACRKWL